MNDKSSPKQDVSQATKLEMPNINLQSQDVQEHLEKGRKIIQKMKDFSSLNK
jgi:hypothetical protein